MSFVLLAALMLAAALALVLRPLLRGSGDAAAQRRRQLLQEAYAAGVLDEAEFAAKRAALADAARSAAPVRSRTAFRCALAVAFAVPVAAVVLYRSVGEPRALDPAAVATAAPPPGEHDGQSMDQAIEGLAAKLKQNPDDVEGWALLGRAYLETQRFAEAREALGRAHALAANDPDIAVAYAEAMTLAGATHRLDGEARALIETALKADPKNQRGIWLLGIADYQNKRYDDAIARWRQLLALLPQDASVAQSVNNQIARAEAERDGRAPPPEAVAATGAAEATTGAAVSGAGPPAAAAPAADEGGTRLTVRVALDPKFAGQVAPGDTVFVYAKAASGPPMPLAIRRLTASQLPATVVLTDGMGMLPNMKLSQFPQVIVGARVSKSGNAIASSGDLQTLSKPLAVAAATAPIALTIDQQVP